MRGDNPLANNLLARLFSYTPRDGRDPLEDFCTETLAWCLRANSDFCKSFLRLFDLDYQPDLKIETQLPVGGKRFDLAVSSYEGNFFVVFENKVWSDFGKEQLSNYRKIIDRQFGEFANRHVAPVTPFSERPAEADKHCAWPQVQELLDVFGNNKAKELQFVCSWFADFLAHQGLKPMKIKIQKIQDYFEGFLLREDMKYFLDGLRKTTVLKPLLKNREAKFEHAQGDLWLGVYGSKAIRDFWLGFQMRPSPPGIYVRAQRSFAGDRRKLFKKLKTHPVWGNQLVPESDSLGGCFLPQRGDSWFHFGKLLNKDFCTDDKIREWFVAAAKFMRDLDKAK